MCVVLRIFDGMTKKPEAPKAIENARVLLNVGDFITTVIFLLRDLSRVILPQLVILRIMELRCRTLIPTVLVAATMK